MPKDEFDLNDPMELVGVEIPTEEETLDEMAQCFVEEFVRLGYPDEAILLLFKKPFYRGPNMIYRIKGEDYIQALIEEVRSKWGYYAFQITQKGDGGNA